MTLGVVLDAGAFDVLATPAGASLRSLLAQTAARGGLVTVAAVTLAEVARGAARTRWVQAAVARTSFGARIVVVPTDERLAYLAASILHTCGRGSEHIADAHVVAVAARFDVAVVATTDPDDIAALSVAVPGTRVLTRRP